jgi:hypothetical protein
LHGHLHHTASTRTQLNNGERIHQEESREPGQLGEDRLLEIKTPRSSDEATQQQEAGKEISQPTTKPTQIASQEGSNGKLQTSILTVRRGEDSTEPLGYAEPTQEAGKKTSLSTAKPT